MIDRVKNCLAALLLAWTISSCSTQPAVGSPIDKRITDSLNRYSYLEMPPDIKPTDQNQRLQGCLTVIMDTPGGYDARRAQNLAATGHLAEAIVEWTRAIDCYGADDKPQTGGALSPKWLLDRARLYAKIGMPAEALADIERSLSLEASKKADDFGAALLLTELGRYPRAESVLSASATQSVVFARPYHLYLLAFSQHKQAKNAEAKSIYIEAATQLAASNEITPAQACLDAANEIDGINKSNHTSLQISDLQPPKSNYANIEKLFKALCTRADIFDLDMLKGLTGASSFKETPLAIFAMPYKSHYPEIQLLSIDKLQSGGKCLKLHMEPVLCSINKSALKDLLQNPVEVEGRWRKESAWCERYNVPAGTLLLSMRKGPF